VNLTANPARAAGLRIETRAGDVRNNLTIKYNATSSAEISASDATSISNYGTLSQIITTTLHNSADATAQANFYLGLRKDPQPNFSEITFACANASFYLLNDNEIFDFKGDRISIGGKQLEESRIFITQTVPHHLNNGRFFLTSDGYTDQFGGDDFKKFLIKRFKELILNTSELSLVDTQTMFENNLNTWIGKNKQMDDILVIGAKF
jgi:hypothetical protein